MPAAVGGVMEVNVVVVVGEMDVDTDEDGGSANRARW